jgi:hypothetical protein
MLRTRFRPASVAALAVLAAAVAGTAGCGTAGQGAASLPRATSAASTNSAAESTDGPARHHAVRSVTAPNPRALPAAVRYRLYCMAGEIPVPFRPWWLHSCGGSACWPATAAGSGSSRAGAGTRPQPAGPARMFPCGRPFCCVCPLYWRPNRLNGSAVLPGRGSPPHLAGKDESSLEKVVPIQVCPMGRAR